MKRYKIGLVIGRFQPFHKGHQFLIEKALESCDKIIILVAASNLHDENNPYSAVRRKKMVKKFVVQEAIDERVIKITSQNNYPDDTVWLQKLLRKTGKVDVVIGNNEWVNGIFEDAGIAALRIGHLDREILEGLKIRKLMRRNKSWENRVPEYLVEDIKKNLGHPESN